MYFNTMNTYTQLAHPYINCDLDNYVITSCSVIMYVTLILIIFFFLKSETFDSDIR